MRTRILPIIGISFAVLLLTRSIAVSSEITPNEPAVAEKNNAPISLPTEQCLTGLVLETVSADIERLEIQKREMAERETALIAIEEKLATQMSAIEDATSALQTNIDSLKAIANEDIQHLVGMYQTMKPKQAADIFNSMDPSFAAGFLREMSSDKAGLIMANMDAPKSYAISVIIARQNSKYRYSQ
ncbi:MAG: hypothetical protein ABJ275_02280 [Maricaulaceae bacterium]